mgnify:CR=1 FL=1
MRKREAIVTGDNGRIRPAINPQRHELLVKLCRDLNGPRLVALTEHRSHATLLAAPNIPPAQRARPCAATPHPIEHIPYRALTRYPLGLDPGPNPPAGEHAFIPRVSPPPTPAACPGVRAPVSVA